MDIEMVKTIGKDLAEFAIKQLVKSIRNGIASGHINRIEDLNCMQEWATNCINSFDKMELKSNEAKDDRHCIRQAIVEFKNKVVESKANIIQHYIKNELKKNPRLIDQIIGKTDDENL